MDGPSPDIRYRITICVLATLIASFAAHGATAQTPATGGQAVLEVWPKSIELVGSRATAQLVVTLCTADGKFVDCTADARLTLEKPIARVEPTAYLRGVSDGDTIVVVEAGGLKERVPLAVRKSGEGEPVSFRHEVVAALNVAGCNQGACHGSPTGKNGFRLSLRGSDPAADFAAITRDQFGRRSTGIDPEASLILRKGRGVMPHEGGPRWSAQSDNAVRVRDWLAAGAPDDRPALPGVARLEVAPADRILIMPASRQQLAVRAHFSDGRVADVTRLCVFSSSDTRIADADDLGRVNFERPGEVAILVRYLTSMEVVRLTCLEPKPGFRWPDPPEQNELDRIVFSKLRVLQIAPSEICGDAEFLRRASLDLTGALPTPEAARAFLSDPTPNKRARAIDRLLESPAHADFWALKWSDVLRASRRTMQPKGARALHDWLRGELLANAPFDRVVRELLTASGSTAIDPAANFFRASRDPASMAESAAQVFCGIRLQCAKCHNHPSDRWTQDDYLGMSAYFARVRTKPDPTFSAPGKNDLAQAEIVFLDRDGEVKHPRTGQPVAPRPLGGRSGDAASVDRRIEFAAWLTGAGNPYFARSVANRLWYHLLGRGLVEPVDDFRDSNPPSHPELLDFLSRQLTEHRFDLRHVLRLILNSRVYQTSDRPTESNRDDVRYFSRAIARPLTAEQLLDAIGDVTGVPEPFAGLPPGTRAVQLPDSDGLHPFLRAFGQPSRELACECERDPESNLAQALQLISGPTVHDKLRAPANRIGAMLAGKKSQEEMLQELYLAAFGRLPLPTEQEAAREHLTHTPDPRKAWEDLAWVLLNSHEFLFRR